MSKCIDREKLIKRLEATCNIVCQYSKAQRFVMCGSCGLGSALEVLEDFPTADVAEVKRGRWEEVTREILFDGVTCGMESRAECSVCHKEPLYSRWHNEMQTPYCPWCGAKMDEVTA